MAVLPLLLLLLRAQVPDSIKSDPRELQHLLDESKHIARDLDGKKRTQACSVHQGLILALSGFLC
jgi:hypothetical protein